MKKLSFGLVIWLACTLAVAGCSKNSPTEPKLAAVKGRLLLTFAAIDNVASGQVIITKGDLALTSPITIKNYAGSAAFDGVEAGTWSIQVQLFNSDHIEIYSGTASAAVAKGQLTVAEINVGPSTGKLYIKVKVVGNLLLWNKLDSDAEVLSSLSGPNGAITGSLQYSAVKFGNGFTCGNSSSYPAFDNVCLDNTKGAIEFWFKTNFSVVNGRIPNDSWFNQDWVIQGPEGGDYHITIGFDNGQFNIEARAAGDGVLNFYGVGNWSANEAHHFAFTYDFATWTICVYLDGKLINSYTQFGEIMPWDYDKGSEPVKILANTSSNSRKVYIDNIKIWDYPKNDFSDRNTE